MGSKAIIVCFVSFVFALGATRLRGQTASESVPPSSTDIADLFGSDADARAALLLVLTHAMAAREARQEYFLANQVRADWLPSLPNVEFVRLADSEVAGHLAACGTYWVINTLERHDATVSLMLSARCGFTSMGYVVSFDGQQWHLGPPGTGTDRGWAPGIGDGRDRSPDCPCD